MSNTPLVLRAPAKLNLGLEVIERRRDGYHELKTVFQAISIFDELHYESGAVFAYRSDTRLDPTGDIVRPLIERSAAAHRWTGTVRLEKTIPLAAGLGGGSSDAALALRLAASAADENVDLAAAAQVGADVPFFLAGGTALATGIGEKLRALPTPPLWFVVHVPPISIPKKTTTLFAGLRATDFSDGSTVEGFASALATGRAALPEELPNAFQHQMLEHDVVREAWILLRSLSGCCALTGAGPAMYSWHADEREAYELHATAAASLGGATFLARALPPHEDEADLRRVVRQLSGRADFRN